MTIIVLRHATRKRDDDPATEEYCEKNLPLDTIGQTEARELGAQLAERGLRPAVYFTSCFAHAKETGEILRETVARQPAAKVVQLCALTPHYQGPREWRCSKEWKGVRILATIDNESRATGNDLRTFDVVAFVMHFPRLAQLLGGMTSESESQFTLSCSEGVCVEAESFDAFLRGEGKEVGPRFSRSRANPPEHLPR